MTRFGVQVRVGGKGRSSEKTMAVNATEEEEEEG